MEAHTAANSVPIYDERASIKKAILYFHRLQAPLRFRAFHVVFIPPPIKKAISSPSRLQICIDNDFSKC